MSKMLKSSGALACATLASRILGLARDTVYSNFMGTTPVASAFMLAFQVPNLFRRLLGEGALSAAFIPIFKKKEATEGDAEMWRAANAVLSGLFAVASVMSLLTVLGISIALRMHVFRTDTELMLQLLRIMFPYTLLVCLAAALIGMANARNQFFIPALGASALNVVMIASVWFLAPHMGKTLDKQIFALAIGVLVAGVAQTAFQLPGLHREGFRFRWVAPWRDATVREVVRKMGPASIGVAAFQINILVTQSFSFWFEKDIVSIFYYATRLMEFPQGMFGISLATYLLPTLSGLASRKDYGEFRSTLKQGLGYLAFVNLLAAAMAFALAQPIVRLIFEHGKFGPEASFRVASVLMALAPGLFFFSAVNILARAFYALHDIRTPMKISIFCLCLNLVFALILVQRFREVGLGVANSISSVFNASLLLYALRKKLSRLEMADLRRHLIVLFASALAAGAAAWLTWKSVDQHLGHATFRARVVGVFVPMTIGCGVCIGIALLLRVPYVHDIFALIPLKFRRAKPNPPA
jgi:putative peptidoglycan lipid II flippase